MIYEIDLLRSDLKNEYKKQESHNSRSKRVVTEELKKLMLKVIL